jgi:hypothetical protein
METAASVMFAAVQTSITAASGRCEVSNLTFLALLVMAALGCGGQVSTSNVDATSDDALGEVSDAVSDTVVILDTTACGSGLDIGEADSLLDQAVGACLGTPYWCGNAIANVDEKGVVTKYWISPMPPPTADQNHCLDATILGAYWPCGRSQTLGITRCAD